MTEPTPTTSAPSRPYLTLAVLDAYYGESTDLLHYLVARLDNSHGRLGETPAYLLRESDSAAYRTLLTSAYVASKASRADAAPKRPFQVYPPMMYMKEIIDKAQEMLFVKAKGKAGNMITCGYRMSSHNGDVGKHGRYGITNLFVNTIITALKAPEWETLLQRIGIDAMLHLLTETSIFVSLPNQCLCQVTGDPLIHMVPPASGVPARTDSPPANDSPAAKTKPAKRKASDQLEDERPRKRLRLYESASSMSTANAAPGTARPTQSVSPVNIRVVRTRMFYARPECVPNQTHIVVGLPPTHILNRIRPSYRRKPQVDAQKYVDPDPRVQAEHARHLAKYVFPRQHGLANVFEIAARPTFGPVPVPEFSDRELEIKSRGKCKTPKRLRETLALLDKMLWRHGKCAYKALRDKACPSKIKPDGAEVLDTSIILEMMSERSICLQTQAAPADMNVSVDTSGWPVLPHGLSQAEKQGKKKPRFAEFTCSHTEVYRYAVLVTKAVIPNAFWGSAKNTKLMLSHIRDFVSCRRYETLTIHHVVQGFGTADCEWLMPLGPGAQKQSRVSVTDALKRRELLEEFLYWYFASFLLPLLKTTFYITESSAFRNQMLYFRHDDWEILCAPLIDRLTSETFEKMTESEAKELLRQRKLGYSFVRLLPKETGVRPIVNLRKRKQIRTGVYGRPEQSINQILQAAFQILNYEKQSQPKLLGASIFGPNDFYTKLKAFKSRLLANNGGHIPKLFFVKLDVQACFDTIEQTKLLQILRELISEDAYLIQRYGQVNSVAGKIQRKYVKKACPEDDQPHFLEYAAELANFLRHTIFVDQVAYASSKRGEVLRLLEEHITENIVKIGKDYYRQMVGIPQGSVLSTLLCSFFYGDLETRFFKFDEDPQSVLLRHVDDYLLVTTSHPKARNFLDTMSRGHPEYGCIISQDKTLTNFDYDAQIMNVTDPRQQRFPWCGYSINMHDLSVSVDYTRYQGNCLQDSLTVEKGKRPGAVFLQKMLQQSKLRSHIIYCDSGLNTEHTIYLNIYQNFVLTAMKMHRYIRTWGINTSKNSRFIQSTIRQMIQYTYITIRNKGSNHVARVSAARCEIQKCHVYWLGTYAFHAVFARKSSNYQAVMKHLNFDLSLPRHRVSRRRFRSLVKEGLAAMAHIAF